MNEQIKQLAEQALNEYSATYHNEAKIPEAYLKKFAELIVQKCADIGERYADGNYEVRNQILEYFGLEDPEE
jgi:uncharacterized protein YutE (UPF0331/DUF86 family)